MFFLFCVWLLKQPFLLDGTDSDSLLFRLLATWKCFSGKIYYVHILPEDISSNSLKNLLIWDGVIKSEVTNAQLSFRAAIALS